jgi:hypothetical protein
MYVETGQGHYNTSCLRVIRHFSNRTIFGLEVECHCAEIGRTADVRYSDEVTLVSCAGS